MIVLLVGLVVFLTRNANARFQSSIAELFTGKEQPPGKWRFGLVDAIGLAVWSAIGIALVVVGVVDMVSR